MLTKVAVLGSALLLSFAALGAARAQAATPGAWQIAWQQSVPPLTAPPQASDGLVYVFSGNDVLALDVASGTPIWTVQPPPPRGRALQLGCCQAGAVPTTGGLYTLAGGDEVRALDPATGATRWRRALGDAILAPPVGAPPIVAVLALEGEEAVLYGLDGETGEPRWRAEPGRSAPVLGAVDGIVFLPLARGGTGAYAAADGRLLWSGGPSRRPALVSARQVFGDLAVLPADKAIMALEAASGAQRWAAPLPDAPLELQVLGDAVYVGSFDGSLVAIDAASGRERWRVDIGKMGMQVLSGPSEGRLFGAGYDGIVALDAATGRRLWARPTERVAAPPLALDGVVYVGTLTGDLLVLDPATGAERARVPLGDPVPAEPLPASNDLLLVPTDGVRGSGLVAIRRPSGQ